MSIVKNLLHIILRTLPTVSISSIPASCVSKLCACLNIIQGYAGSSLPLVICFQTSGRAACIVTTVLHRALHRPLIVDRMVLGYNYTPCTPLRNEKNRWMHFTIVFPSTFSQTALILGIRGSEDTIAWMLDRVFEIKKRYPDEKYYSTVYLID